MVYKGRYYGGAEASRGASRGGAEASFRTVGGGLDLDNKSFIKNPSTPFDSLVAFKSLHCALHVEVFILFCNELYFSSKELKFCCNE